MGQDGRVGRQESEAWNLTLEWTLLLWDLGQHPALSCQGLQQRSTSPDSGAFWAGAAMLTEGTNSGSRSPEDGGKGGHFRPTLQSCQH